MKKKIFSDKTTLIIFSIILLWILISFISISKQSNIKNYDAISVFFYTLAYSTLSMLQIGAPIIIMYISIHRFHKELNTGTVKNFLTRQSYSEYLKRIFKYSIKYVWVLPISMLFLFLLCYLTTRNFDFNNALPQFTGYSYDGMPIIVGGYTPINIEFYNMPVKLMLTFFIVLALHSLFYANIGLIMSKKNKNIVITLVLSFVTFIGINLLSEIVLSYIFIKKLKFDILNGIFNLFGIWVYCDLDSLLALIIYSVILVIISYIILFITYKDKEKVIIEIEK